LKQINLVFLGWLLLGWLLPGTAGAASFDCGKTRTDVEKMICADDALSKLDDTLNEKYQQALKRSDIRDQVIESQQHWLKNARNTCQTSACVKSAYDARIKELRLTSSFGIVFMTLPPSRKLPEGASPLPSRRNQ